jgi:hypothetical protein
MSRPHSWRPRCFIGVLVLLAALSIYRTASAATLFGTIGLSDEDGHFIPGAMVRLYLVTELLPFEFTEDKSLNRYERIVRINKAHMDFFKKFQEKEAQAGYLKTVAESSIAGTFTFPNIPCGRYFVLVTFPSMVAGHKVAWQVPIEIPADDYYWIQLTSENLLLPAIAR